MGLSPVLEGCRAASLYDSRIAAATHHYLKVKAELQQSLLLCEKSILIWASFKKKNKTPKTTTKHSPPPPPPRYLVLNLVERGHQFQCKTENHQFHSYSQLGYGSSSLGSLQRPVLLLHTLQPQPKTHSEISQIMQESYSKKLQILTCNEG